ncbi:MAG: DUF1461 domain-containing protein [Chloroflexi bacterium]|nr:DUF1461 domain-containing protein [Chloroflexota bacterium]
MGTSAEVVVGPRALGVVLARWAIIILTAPVLLLSNLYLLLTPTFIDLMYSLDIPPAQRYDVAERREFAVATLSYLRSPRDISALRELADEQGPLYKERELRHMGDVKTLANRLLTIGLFALGGLFLGLSFNTFLVNFHRLFFTGNSWLFPYSDSLIQLFPPAFWSNAALAWAGLTLLEAAALAGLSLRLRPSRRS